MPIANDISDHPLWVNHRITNAGQCIFVLTWYTAGICKIHDIMDPSTKQFKSIQQFEQDFDLTNNFLDIATVTSAIPKPWRQAIQKPNVWIRPQKSLYIPISQLNLYRCITLCLNKKTNILQSMLKKNGQIVC